MSVSQHLSVVAGEALQGADLRGRNFTNQDLRGANLEGADLRGAELSGALLTDANLRGVRAEGAGFGSAVLDGALLCGADLRKCSFTGASLKGATLQAVDLTGARMVRADLSGADLAAAVVREVDFSNAKLDDAVFRDADLTRARFSGATGYTRVNWSGVNVLDADLNGAHLFRRHVTDELFLEEFRNQSRANAVIYWLWSVTSDCGRSLSRWAGVTFLIALLFAAVYAVLPIDYGDHPTWLSPVYFSIVTLTTLGFGDALPTTVAGQITVMLEVIVGYMMLGGLISILSNKMARRA